MTNEQLRSALALLASQQAKLIIKPNRLANINVFIPIITALITGLGGAYLSHQLDKNQKEMQAQIQRATNDISNRQQLLHRSEVLNQFIPYLSGTEEQVRMAIIAISSVGDTHLMEAIAGMTWKRGITRGFEWVAENDVDSKVREKAAKLLPLIKNRKASDLAEEKDKLRAKAFELAEDQIGVHEEPPGSSRSLEIDDYNTSVGVNVGEKKWGNSFVLWCYKKTKLVPPGIELSPNLDKIMQNLKDLNRWEPASYEPKTGDLVFLRPARDSTTSYTGIVVFADKNYLRTIEGNTGNGPDSGRGGSGGAVVHKRHPLADVIGYGNMEGE